VRFGGPVRRRGKGFELRLETWERDVLRSLPGQMRELLATDDPALERLFPPAYLHDDEKNDEYRRLVKQDLTDKRLEAIDVLEATVDATRVDEEQLLAWMGALNDVRLVLGTRLEVTEEMYDRQLDEDDPRAHGFALYSFLGYLQEAVVAALSQGI